jgi:hypothetical protein
VLAERGNDSASILSFLDHSPYAGQPELQKMRKEIESGEWSPSWRRGFETYMDVRLIGIYMRSGPVRQRATSPYSGLNENQRKLFAAKKLQFCNPQIAVYHRSEFGPFMIERG